MRAMTPVTVLSLLIIAGCASEDEMRFTKGKGDLGDFILEHALTRGARPIATNDLPSVEGDWRYSEDQYGVVLHLPRERFNEIHALLRHVFGPPGQEPIEIPESGMLGWYGAKDIGVGVQFGYDEEGTQVIILRPQSMDVVLEHMQKAMEEVDE